MDKFGKQTTQNVARVGFCSLKSQNGVCASQVARRKLGQRRFQLASAIAHKTVAARCVLHLPLCLASLPR